MLNLLLNILLFCFTSDSINIEIREYIIKSLPGYDKYEVKIVSLKSHSRLLLDSSTELARNNNLVYVPVIYEEKSGKQSKSMITCEVRLFKNVLVANRDLRSGENLTLTDFDQIEYDIAKLNNVCTSIDELENKRAAGFIKKGELLKTNSLEEIPQILAGGLIMLHSVKGSADVQVDAVAQQDGYIDNIIRVKTRDNKLYKAKIIDYKNVLINE